MLVFLLPRFPSSSLSFSFFFLSPFPSTTILFGNGAFLPRRYVGCCVRACSRSRGFVCATPTHGCDDFDPDCRVVILYVVVVYVVGVRVQRVRVWYCIHRTGFGRMPGLRSSRPIPPSRSASSAHTFSFLLYCFIILTCSIVLDCLRDQMPWTLAGTLRCFRWLQFVR